MSEYTGSRAFRTRLLFFLVLAGLAFLVSAGGASPLATQEAMIGPYRVLLSFYSLPHAGQALNMTIESEMREMHVLFSHAKFVPGAGTDANILDVQLVVDRESASVYDVDVTPPIRGKWLFELQIEGSAGTATGSIPIQVDGPPAIPTWLGWLLGLSPLPFIVVFLWLQVRWRKRLSSAPDML